MVRKTSSSTTSRLLKGLNHHVVGEGGCACEAIQPAREEQKLYLHYCYERADHL